MSGSSEQYHYLVLFFSLEVTNQIIVLHPAISVSDKPNIAHRIANVAEESFIILAPICGYKKYPLVSLEEAVKPLLDIVPGISSYVYAVKQRATNPADSLSIDESAAIALYTMEMEPYTNSIYYILNSILRIEERQKLKPWFLYLKLILTALFRLPSNRGIKVVSDHDYKKYRVEVDIVWWSFSSCSVKRDVCEKENFCTQTGKRILFVIKCIKGKDISKHSYFKNEREILILPGTAFDFVNYEKQKDDLHVIYLKEIEPQFIFFESPLYEKEIKYLKNEEIPTKNATIPGEAVVKARRYVNPILTNISKTFKKIF